MKTVLYISTAGAQFWCQNAHTWQPCDSFVAGTLWVVCNLPEESFAEIQIPRIFGRDRQNYIQRQLTNRFPDTPYRTMVAQPGSGGLMERFAPQRQTVFGVDAAQRIHEALDGVLDASVAGVWATSMLMSQMSGHKSLPDELFLVWSGVDGLRIVFVKSHVPVISRLVPGVMLASDQAAEIARTVRYLENNRLLVRTGESRNVLLLDQPQDLLPWLAQEQLNPVVMPSVWHKKVPVDWRSALFDLVVTSPAGQLAPLSRRTRFIANRLKPLANVASLLSVIVAVWASIGNFNDIVSGYAGRKMVQQRVDQLTLQTQDADKKIANFGVSAQSVRSAVLLEHDEIASAPSFSNHMQQLSGIVSTVDTLRLQQLDWKILLAGQTACGDKMAEAITSTSAQSPAALAPNRVVEISFKIPWPTGQSEKSRVQIIADLSTKLTKIEGVKLWVDPAQNLQFAALTGGSGASENSLNEAFTWCLTLPGSTQISAVTRQP